MLVLVVDDEPRLRASIAEMLREAGWDVLEAGMLEDARLLLEAERPAAALCDLRLPDGDGMELVRYARERGLDTAIIVMTAFGNREVALEAIREGAFDYVAKPIRFNELFARLARIRELFALRVQAGKGEAGARFAVLGESPAMRRVAELAERAAASDAPLLILGETGVGKGMLARLVHEAGPRANEPFVQINCASIPENLLEAELFGYRKGAFTGADRTRRGLLEEAGRGTLFLDEIGEMPLALQAKLLHVLDDRRFRPLGGGGERRFFARVIAATNVRLDKAVAARRFREDLFYRLSVLVIEIPPLRERPEDLLPIAERIYARLAREMGKNPQLPDALAREILAHDWPGNVRELKNFLERALIFGAENQTEEGLSLAEATARFERAWIMRALRISGGDKRKAARMLGIGLSTLYRKLEEARASHD